MKVGRNAPCPCGSGKKYKSCCERNAAPQRDWSKPALIGVAVAMALGALGFVVSLFNAGGAHADGRVWSAEHGHWHAADGSELNPGTPQAQPPGPAPAGKVWSSEHGHWHDE